MTSHIFLRRIASGDISQGERVSCRVVRDALRNRNYFSRIGILNMLR
jgi:hypothetical protein